MELNENPFYIRIPDFILYRRTESPLQIALLALFTEMQYRFPAFCLGMLTRESVRQALKSGITAEQIINFLTINAHPTLVDQHPPVPSTIMDQIRLWEIERDRFVYRDGVLYSQFLSQSDFELLRNYARVSRDVLARGYFCLNASFHYFSLGQWISHLGAPG